MVKTNKDKRVVQTFNTLSSSGPMRNRHNMLSERKNDLTWTLDKISGGWSQSLRDKLREALAGLTNLNNLQVTSAEQLEAWGRTKKADDPYLGTPVAVNVPVMCLGAPVTDRNRDLLLKRGLPEDYPKHTRFLAHGMTWGTVYLKPRYVTGKDGKRSTDSFTLFHACNSCLDTYVGKLPKNGQRSTENWPSSWVQKERTQQPDQKRSNRGKKGKGKGKKQAPALSATKVVLEKVNFGWKDPIKKVTLTMLKAAAKEQGFQASGNKASMFERFQEHLVSTGDKELLELLNETKSQD